MKKFDNSEYLRDVPISFKKNHKQQISLALLIKLMIR